MTRSCHGEDNPCQRCTEGIEQEETGETHNCDQPAGKHHRYYHRRGNKRYVKVVYGALVAVVGYVGHKHNGYVESETEEELRKEGHYAELAESFGIVKCHYKIQQGRQTDGDDHRPERAECSVTAQKHAPEQDAG